MRRTAFILMLTATMLASGCTSEPVAAPITLELTTTTSQITTTTSTTEAETTTTVDPRIADVEAAVDAYIETITLLVLDPSQPTSMLLAVATPEFTATLEANLLRGRAVGRVGSGRFEWGPSDVEFGDGIVAKVTRCGLDAVELASADGEVLVPADKEALIRIYSVAEGVNGWRVSGFEFPNGLETPCEL